MGLYTIVGRGFAAVLNDVTLRATDWGRSRTNGHTIQFIGGPDPWARYGMLQMGQWPNLLTLPAFHHHPFFSVARECLSSSSFADATAREHGAGPDNGVVLGIEPPSAGGGAYTVYLQDRTAPVLADYVDICTGPGRPRRFWMSHPTGCPKPSVDSQPVTEANRCGDIGWCRLMTGEQFLSAPVPNVESLCILGQGATAAWCVERAIQHAKVVVWAGPDRVNSAMIPGGRNDRLVSDSDRTAAGLRRRAHPGRFPEVLGDLLPACENLTIAEGLCVRQVTLDGHGKVRIEFEGRGTGGVRCVDRNGNSIDLERFSYDAVIGAVGQERYPEEPGSSEALLKNVPLLRPLTVSGSTLNPLGLETPDGRLRVLGAAAHQHRRIRERHLSTREPGPLLQYLLSLPDQAQSDVGVTFCAVLIATANHYFQEFPNDNLNTATYNDLLELFGDAARVDALLQARREPLLDEQVEPYGQGQCAYPRIKL